MACKSAAAGFRQHRCSTEPMPSARIGSTASDEHRPLCTAHGGRVACGSLRTLQHFSRPLPLLRDKPAPGSGLQHVGEDHSGDQAGDCDQGGHGSPRSTGRNVSTRGCGRPRVTKRRPRHRWTRRGPRRESRHVRASSSVSAHEMDTLAFGLKAVMGETHSVRASASRAGTRCCPDRPGCEPLRPTVRCTQACDAEPGTYRGDSA